MIFFTTRPLRTTFARTALVMVAGTLVASALYFRYDTAPLERPCGECDASARVFYETREGNRTVSLTFDDGPDPSATPKILEVLDTHHTHATFFVLGSLALKSPELTREIIARGHTIGNHSYTHAEEVHQSRERIAWELSMNSKIVESITGVSPVLYRPPYLLDMDPYEVFPPLADREPVWRWVHEEGFVTIGTDLDSFDWQTRTAEGVLANVEARLAELDAGTYGKNRHIFLFHDLPQTADALEEILTLIEARGYTVVPLSQTLGLSEAQVMPQAPRTVTRLWNDLFMNTYDVINLALLAAVTLITVFTTLRFALFVYASFELVPRLVKTYTKEPRELVSVLVPAYNEAENIVATIRTILANSRVPDEVLIINDGSTDDTLMHAEAVAAEYPELVRVISVVNGGKARALNIGFAQAKGDIIVAIDGDTVLDQSCIREVVRPFVDPSVGAVAGKIVPASARTLLEKYQLLEYLVGQNMDKVIIGLTGAVNIVPGAIGAWRRRALRDAGGYSADTLVEDQDLTLAVLALGYKVVYVPGAIAYTEVPTTLRAFYLQRFRWTYGTFQCMWKYRSYLLSEDRFRLGWVALPYAFVFNVVLPLVALFLYFGLALGLIMRISTPALPVLLFFTALDILYAYLALRREPARTKYLIPHIILQRFAYIFIYALLALLVTLKVLDGSQTRWNKLKRTGSAQRLYEESLDPLFLKPTHVV